MLQELASSTGAGFWAVASMLFFLAIYILVAVRVFRAPRHELDARARMALDDEDASGPASGTGTGPTA
jgi:cbb3-type cytochrome oxidase subunit 3